MKISDLTVFVLLLGTACLLSCSSATKQLTAEEIVARCAAVMGGENGLQDLRNLRFQTQRPDRDQPLLWEIVRPNRVRKELPGRLILAFDGSKAAFLQAPPDKDGAPQDPRLIVAEDWHHFEMDIALYVPAFFAYPATYVETTMVRGTPAHLLRVQLPMGGVAEYAIDTATFLPTKVMLPDWSLERHLGDYREVGGFVYFHKYWNVGDPESAAIVLQDLEVNVDLPASRFAIPGFLR